MHRYLLYIERKNRGTPTQGASRQVQAQGDKGRARLHFLSPHLGVSFLVSTLLPPKASKAGQEPMEAGGRGQGQGQGYTKLLYSVYCSLWMDVLRHADKLFFLFSFSAHMAIRLVHFRTQQANPIMNDLNVFSQHHR